MRTVAIVNQKGGCGKTTTTINLAACLADLGKKTLVIDMDPQSHSSLGLNVKAEELELGLYDVLLAGGDHDRPLLDDIVAPVAENLHLVPSSTVLSAFEQKLAGAPGRERRLLEAIWAMQRSYDYIFIDCPPSLGLLSFNALLAAQDVIIPIEPSFFSLHGLGKQIESIQLFSEKLNHKVELHTLVTMFDKRTRLSREVLEEVQKHFPENTFKTVIHLNIRLKEAASYGAPITAFDRKCSGFLDFQALAEEVLHFRPAIVQQHRHETVAPRPVKSGILFSYKAQDVRSLKLVGDFNNWTPDGTADLEKTADGTWHKVLPLAPGKYHYKFIVNGEWKEDPANPKVVVNDFGGVDSVIEVKPFEFPELLQQEKTDRETGQEQSN